MNTELLNELYEKYNIFNLTYGSIHDKLGDAYEEFCIKILTNVDFLRAYKNGQYIDCVEFDIFQSIMHKAGFVDASDVNEITATNKVPHRASRGNAKTDIIATFILRSGRTYVLTISSKQSYVSKVAVAEFDVETICNEVGINDDRVRLLMTKFQVAKSAKGLTEMEQDELKERLRPYARKLVRWAITGSPDLNPTDVVFPTLLIKFKVEAPRDRYNIDVANGDLTYVGFNVYGIEEYVDLIMYDRNGNIKDAGFGTGLAWTYASGSGGRKIQFKA